MNEFWEMGVRYGFMKVAISSDKVLSSLDKQERRVRSAQTVRGLKKEFDRYLTLDDRAQRWSEGGYRMGSRPKSFVRHSDQKKGVPQSQEAKDWSQRNKRRQGLFKEELLPRSKSVNKAYNRRLKYLGRRNKALAGLGIASMLVAGAASRRKNG